MSGRPRYLPDTGFARRLASMRRERRMTQTALAKAANLSVAAVSRWEAEITLPDFGSLLRLAEFFGCTLDALMRGPGEEAAP